MSDGKSTSGPSKKSFDDPKDRKVFVGNISFRVSKKSLWEFFTKFGVVVDCHLVIDHFKRKSKGIGFVTFKSVEAANRAKEAPAEELVLDQREMRVLACESRKRSLERPELSKTSRECESSSEDEGGLRHQSSSDSVASATIMEEGYIKELNDDVLMIVFSKLCIRNRLKVERVCKRWRTLAIKSWKLCQSLHFANVFTLNSGSCLTNEILRRILQRCHHLKKLDLSTASHHLDHRAVVIIARHCPLIYHVNLSGVPTTNADIQQLASKCPNLKEVLVRKNLELGERGLWSLFNQSKQLVEIDISGNSRATGKVI
ncbi:HNRNPAB (predicted) [Pycnogonum litorale]